jgi:phage tail sheath protein FI
MPVSLSYPGVYIEEIPSGVRTIVGVSTSVAAFIGNAPRGPLNQPVRLFDYGSYEREFGGLHRDSELSYAVSQFFLNGGAECWVVRVAQGAATAEVNLSATPGGTQVLNVSAKTSGAWGSSLRIDVDYATSNPDSTFNLSVTEYTRQSGALVKGRSELFRNLSMNSKSAAYAVASINATSQMITVARPAGALSLLTVGGGALSGALTAATSLSGDKRKLQIMVDGDGPYEITLFATGGTLADLDAITAALQAQIRAINTSVARFNAFTVQRATATGLVNAAGTFLLLRSGAAGADQEFSDVRVLPALTEDASKALKLGIGNGGRELDAAAAMRPTVSGKLSTDLAATALNTLSASDQIVVTATEGGASIGTGTLLLGPALPATAKLADLAAQLQSRINASNTSVPAINKATVTINGTRLKLTGGDTERPGVVLTVTEQGAGTLGAALGLLGTAAASSFPFAGGSDGNAATASELTGSRSAKTGIYALELVDFFNILCIPGTGDLTETAGLSVINAATAYCQERRAFFITDPPKARNTVMAVADFVNNSLGKSNYSAVFFPWVQIPDPLDNFRLKDIAPSGTIAGLFARTDTTRGLWKAPAGTEATLVNVAAVSVPMTEMENGVLNQIGCNCLRQFPVYGRINWGARTLRGADLLSDDYKYIPVRRLALNIEESLYRGSKWIVFEPNDEPLWAQIRLNFDAFMHDLFTRGAFQGKTPKEAYFVKCDRETTTQNDINKGIVNIIVGFAPLKPAEFVVIQLQQIANQQGA